MGITAAALTWSAQMPAVTSCQSMMLMPPARAAALSPPRMPAWNGEIQSNMFVVLEQQRVWRSTFMRIVGGHEGGGAGGINAVARPLQPKGVGDAAALVRRAAAGHDLHDHCCQHPAAANKRARDQQLQYGGGGHIE